ncbi:unnamed protein product [Boreogadus saida]
MAAPLDSDGSVIQSDHVCKFKHCDATRALTILESGDTILKDRAWQDVSLEVGETVPECVKRWISLRDRYRRERMKEKEAHRSGAGANNSKKVIAWRAIALEIGSSGDFLHLYCSAAVAPPPVGARGVLLTRVKCAPCRCGAGG